MKGLGASVLAAILLATPAAADLLVHRDGRIFDGIELRVMEDSVLLVFEHGNVEIPMSDVADFIVEHGAGFVPTTDEERERVAGGEVRYKGRWMSATSRDKLAERDAAERREQMQALRAGRLWRNREIVETKNFIFESTAPPHVTEYYRDLCEAYFQEFAKTWKIRRGKVSKLPVKFFVDIDNYRQVTGMSGGTMAFFQFIEPYQLCVFYDRLDPASTEEILFHELGHYLQKLIDVEFKYPHWPGEALSEYYGASSWDPEAKRVEVGKVLAGRVEEIRYDITAGERVSILELLRGAPDRTYADYNWGWSLVHFLMSDRRHSKNFVKFYVGLAKDRSLKREPVSYGRTTLKHVSGATVEEAFRDFMKIRDDDDLEELQKDWYAHIDTQLEVSTVRGLEAAARKNLQRGLPQRARGLLEEAITQGTDRAQTYFLYAELLHGEKEYAKAREYWERAIERDPLVPDYYISLGRYLVTLGDEDAYAEGEEILRLAQDIEPDNFYLDRNLERILREGRRKLKKSP